MAVEQGVDLNGVPVNLPVQYQGGGQVSLPVSDMTAEQVLADIALSLRRLVFAKSLEMKIDLNEIR
jgi:hypothetical protein